MIVFIMFCLYESFQHMLICIIYIYSLVKFRTTSKQNDSCFFGEGRKYKPYRNRRLSDRLKEYTSPYLAGDMLPVETHRLNKETINAGQNQKQGSDQVS